MLFFLTLLMTPFFPQDGMIVENGYVQEINAEEEIEDETADPAILLAYRSGTPAGGVMAISQESSDRDEEDDVTDKRDNGAEDEQSEDDDNEIQKIDCKQITQAMEKEFGEMRMIQLANAIAGDMGMITKVTFAG